MRIIYAILVMFTLVACDIPAGQSGSKPILDLRSTNWVSPDRTADLSQQISIRSGPYKLIVQARLQLTDTEIRLVALDMLGRRAMDVRWGVDGFDSNTADWLPDLVQPEDVLADLVLIYWPLDKLQPLLSEAHISTVANARLIHREIGADIRIDYGFDRSAGSAGSVTLKDPMRRLTVKIQSTEASNE